jgi:hypothetical protein
MRLVFKYLLVVSTLFISSLQAGAPIVYLTWMHDPTTTMTVQWHTNKTEPLSQVFYRKAGEDEWLEKAGVYTELSKENILVHTVELDELEPGGEYQFQVEGNVEVYRFRTMPSDLREPIRFVIGGDAYFYLYLFQKMNAQIAAANPDFVIVGGDIAYTNGTRAFFKGRKWQVKRWRTFLREWTAQMIAPDGRMIPIVPVVGNHDVRGVRLNPLTHEQLFYDFFALPERGVSFRALDMGNYLSLILLDTGHSYLISGWQTDWLKKALAKRENRPYKLAAYHVGAYPSVYPYSGQIPKKIRANWVPLFEKYHLNAAFEHHNHAYKRTCLIKEEKENYDGVLYMGDGSWGVSPRRVNQLWYLKKAAQINAVCVLTVDEEKCQIDAMSIDGKVIDSEITYPRTKPRTGAVACDESRLLQY